MSTTPLLGIIAALWLGLALLAYDSYREMRRRRDAMRDSATNGGMLNFANEETRRALMRSKGWALLFGGVGIIFVKEVYDPIRRLGYPGVADLKPLTYFGLSLVIASSLIFLREALIGRRERRRVLDEGLAASQNAEVSTMIQETHADVREIKEEGVRVREEHAADREQQDVDRGEAQVDHEGGRKHRKLDERGAAQDEREERQDEREKRQDRREVP